MKKNLVTRLATNFKKHIKTFIEALMIVIGEALHNFFSSKTSFQNSKYIQISSQLMQCEETIWRKAEAVQINHRSPDTLISHS